jgi:hypothetical protein
MRMQQPIAGSSSRVVYRVKLQPSTGFEMPATGYERTAVPGFLLKEAPGQSRLEREPVMTKNLRAGPARNQP